MGMVEAGGVFALIALLCLHLSGGMKAGGDHRASSVFSTGVVLQNRVAPRS